MYKPQLPTDNLYKFMALSGLTLVIITTFFYLLFIFETTRDNQRLSFQIEQIMSKSDSNFSKLRSAKNNESIEPIIASISENIKSIDAMEIELLELKANGEGYRTLLKNLTYLGLFGLLLSFQGFGLWYYRVQIYQDQKLKHEVETLASNLKPTYQPLVRRSQNAK